MSDLWRHIRPVIARFTPSAEMLNILIGVLTAGAVNLFTSVASSDHRPKISATLQSAGLLFALAAAALAALSLSLTRMNRELQYQIGPTLSRAERRELLQDRLLEHAARTCALGIIGLAASAAAVWQLAIR